MSEVLTAAALALCASLGIPPTSATYPLSRFGCDNMGMVLQKASHKFDYSLSCPTYSGHPCFEGKDGRECQFIYGHYITEQGWPGETRLCRQGSPEGK